MPNHGRNKPGPFTRQSLQAMAVADIGIVSTLFCFFKEGRAARETRLSFESAQSEESLPLVEAFS
jgi:hypothetical protein